MHKVVFDRLLSPHVAEVGKDIILFLHRNTISVAVL